MPANVFFTNFPSLNPFPNFGTTAHIIDRDVGYGRKRKKRKSYRRKSYRRKSYSQKGKKSRRRHNRHR